jgi:hypothetical protein
MNESKLVKKDIPGVKAENIPYRMIELLVAGEIVAERFKAQESQ